MGGGELRVFLVCHLGHSQCNKLLFIYLFLAALGLRWCTRAFSSCGKQGLLFVVVHKLLAVVAALVEGSRRTGFSSCSMWAQ